jgi:LCP family protein required for cell wall assembly
VINLEDFDNNLNKKKKKKKKKSLVFKISITCIVILSILLSVGLVWGNTILSKMKRAQIDESDLGIKEEVTEKIQTSEIKDIVNIAILGVDENKSSGDVGRSDATMIATFDPVHKKLKITSIMRDTYIDIPDNGKDKLNHAYAFGGAQLSIKTLNQDLGLNIKDYIKINFEELEGLVDAINGIDIELSDEEIVELDDYIVLVSEALNIPTEKLIKNETTGKVHLNGFQTLGYCRIRSTAGGDFDRTERHRKIMTEMFNKISDSNTAQLASMVTKLLPYVETSLTNKEIIDLGANVLNLGTKNIEQERFPRDDYSKNSMIDGIFYLCYDEEYTEQQVHEYIFNDRKMWLEPNHKVYNHDAEHFHNNGVSNNNNTNTQSVTPNTNNNPVENNTNNSDNSSGESQQNNGNKTQGEDNSTNTQIESPTKGTGEKTNP